jgi:transcriptional regulator with XRE-family HTH domain
MSAAVENKVAGVNRTVLAGKLGMDRSYVSQVLNGKREPGLRVALRLTKELGITVEQFGEYLTRKAMVN